ncbi:MAG: hypothetical protein JJ909_10340 [Roseivirga sp.]|uniref:hypothetical protein n=1 Tax=Roseivirga sp. TaxID=1964215 RepID=UPI001B2C9824|nr:hypothetical protein [Roseivirga sp.]MBO6661916.1 hypothetical protein [Roseivirga sp.]MBO6761352.1 hypothetical protein [Roseivirga sp.]MBO6909495.1 hypothetical protein [Roseivirga sp.]
MNRLVLSFLLLIAISNTVSAQYFEEEKKDKEETEKIPLEDRVFFGGNFGLSFSFGDVESQYIEVSPLVGYRFSETFSGGLSLSYLYVSREYIFLPSYNRVKLKNNTYGPRAFLRYRFLDNYFFQTEFESLNTLVPLNDGTSNTGRDWVPGFFIGGGVTYPIGRNLSVNLVLMYNVIYDDNRSPYGSPLASRGGIIVR